MTFYGFGQKRSIFYGHKIWIIISYHFDGFLWLRTNPVCKNKIPLILESLFLTIQYRSDSLSISPACASGACTDFEYIECTIAIIDGIAQ